MNWQQIERPYNTHLDFGQYFAKAQELVFVAYFKHAKSEADAIQEGVNYLENDFMQRYQDCNADEPVKNPTKAVEMLRRYFEECPLEEGDMLPFQLSDNDISVEKGLTMELPFKHPETDLPLKLFSKYDRLCFDSNADIVAVVDTKTSGYASGDTADKIEGTMLKYKMGNQMPQYAVVTNADENKHLIYDRKVNHGEIHLVLTSQKAAGAKGAAIPKKQPFVEKLSFAITDFHQEEWYIAACDLIGDMLERYKKFQETGDVHCFRKSFGNCVPPCPGFRPCEFHRHCTDASWSNIGNRYGMMQGIKDKETGVVMPLVDKRKELGLC